jgi:UDP-N-acetylmuramate dehydrogenase
VARARISLTPDDPLAIKRDINQHMRFRKETQPVGIKSAGCIFKNPAGDSAGRLIDRAGLKGFRVGGARVSEVHANFIVHEGKASTRDVLALIDAVREKVLRETSILLETEVMTWTP